MAKALPKSHPRDDRRIRVAIVDDHPVVRYGLRQRLSLEADMEVCGDASSAAEAHALIAAQHPDVALVDLSLGDGDGLDLIKDLYGRANAVKVLVVSGHDESTYVERCLRAGAHGYLHKNEAIDCLVDAIRTVSAGRPYVSDGLASTLLRKMVGGSPVESTSPTDDLSDRQLQVFEWIGRGLTIPQIGEKLFLSPKTIQTYREQLKRKFNVNTSAQLARLAHQWVLERR